jgi:hypothetical protein
MHGSEAGLGSHLRVLGAVEIESVHPLPRRPKVLNSIPTLVHSYFPIKRPTYEQTPKRKNSLKEMTCSDGDFVSIITWVCISLQIVILEKL